MLFMLALYGTSANLRTNPKQWVRQQQVASELGPNKVESHCRFLHRVHTASTVVAMFKHFPKFLYAKVEWFAVVSSLVL